MGTDERLKLPIFQTIRFAYGFFFRNFGHFTQLIAVPAIALIFLVSLLGWLESRGMEFPFPVKYLPHYLYAWFALFWHRLHLLGPEPTKLLITGKFMDSRGNRSNLTVRFLSTSFGFILLIAVVAGLTVGGFLAGWKYATKTTEIPLYFYPLLAVLSFFLSVFSCRLLPIFTAIAVDKRDFGEKSAWRLTRGNGIRFAAVLWLAAVPLAVILLMALFFIMLIDPGETPFEMAWLGLLVLFNFSLVAILASCNSLAFLFLNGETMTSEIDAYRSAKPLIDQHGDEPAQGSVKKRHKQLSVVLLALIAVVAVVTLYELFDYAKCSERTGNPDFQIDYCTRVIDSGGILAPLAYNKRGLLNGYKGEYDQAISDFGHAIRLNPDYAEAFDNFARLLAKTPDTELRDGRKAVTLATKAVLLNDTPAYRNTLAAAFAEAGQFDDAVAEQERAIEMLRALGRNAEVAAFQTRLDLYRRRQINRE